MNIKLSFTPVSQNPVDLLVFVLDARRPCTRSTIPSSRAHLERAAARLPREDAQARVLRHPARGRPRRARWSPTGAPASRAGTSGRT